MTTAHTTISRRRQRTAAASEVAPVGIPSPTGAAPTRAPWITTNLNGAIVVQAMEGTYALCDAGWMFSPVDHPHLEMPVACADTLVWLDAERRHSEILAGVTGRNLTVVA